MGLPVNLYICYPCLPISFIYNTLSSIKFYDIVALYYYYILLKFFSNLLIKPFNKFFHSPIFLSPNKKKSVALSTTPNHRFPHLSLTQNMKFLRAFCIYFYCSIMHNRIHTHIQRYFRSYLTLKWKSHPEFSAHSLLLFANLYCCLCCDSCHTNCMRQQQQPRQLEQERQAATVK